MACPLCEEKPVFKRRRIMALRGRKKRLRTLMTGVGLVALVSLWGGDAAFAYRDRRPDAHPRGKVVVKLPRGHRAVRVGKDRYYHHRGVFYRRGPSGYVVVGAPIGAVVLSIPVGSRAVVAGGLTYYLYGGAYYRRARTGYAVVEPPAKTVIVKEVSPLRPSVEQVGDRVSVTATLLNVRSGPGMGFPVIHQLRDGDLLTVHGYAPEWLYVKLPAGEFGWVMVRYTTSKDPGASG